MVVLPVLMRRAHLPEKWSDSIGRAKVIIYRLIDERPQTFNDSYHTVSSIINAYEN